MAFEELKVPFLSLCEKGDVTEIKHMLNYVEVSKCILLNQGLYRACEYGKLDVVHFLLLKGKYDHIDIPCYNNCLLYACKGGDVNIVQLMLNRGACTILLTWGLIHACNYSRYNVILFLLQNGTSLIYVTDHWFLQQESVQIRLLSSGITRSQLQIILNIQCLFTRLDETNRVYTAEISLVLPVRDLVPICAGYICL